MTELQKRAKEYLILKGVKSTGDKFIALEVMDLLCEFAQREQLTLTDVSQQRELFYNFITWYNAKPKVEKNKDGLVTIGVIDEFLKL